MTTSTRRNPKAEKLNERGLRDWEKFLFPIAERSEPGWTILYWSLTHGGLDMAVNIGFGLVAVKKLYHMCCNCLIGPDLILILFCKIER